MCIRGIRNVSFSDNFTYALNEWSQRSNKTFIYPSEVIYSSWFLVQSSYNVLFIQVLLPQPINGHVTATKIDSEYLSFCLLFWIRGRLVGIKNTDEDVHGLLKISVKFIKIFAKENFLRIFIYCIRRYESKNYHKKKVSTSSVGVLFKALENIRGFLVFECITSQNGQTRFKNLAANAARFLKYVWPF